MDIAIEFSKCVLKKPHQILCETPTSTKHLDKLLNKYTHMTNILFKITDLSAATMLTAESSNISF